MRRISHREQRATTQNARRSRDQSFSDKGAGSHGEDVGSDCAAALCVDAASGSGAELHASAGRPVARHG